MTIPEGQNWPRVKRSRGGGGHSRGILPQHWGGSRCPFLGLQEWQFWRSLFSPSEWGSRAPQEKRSPQEKRWPQVAYPFILQLRIRDWGFTCWEKYKVQVNVIQDLLCSSSSDLGLETPDAVVSPSKVQKLERSEEPLPGPSTASLASPNTSLLQSWQVPKSATHLLSLKTKADSSSKGQLSSKPMAMGSYCNRTRRSLLQILCQCKPKVHKDQLLWPWPLRHSGTTQLCLGHSRRQRKRKATRPLNHWPTHLCICRVVISKLWTLCYHQRVRCRAVLPCHPLPIRYGQCLSPLTGRTESPNTWSDMTIFSG